MRDGDQVHKGLKFGKVYGILKSLLPIFFVFWSLVLNSVFTPVIYAGLAYSVVVAERVVLNFMQRMSGIATITKVLRVHEDGVLFLT